MKIKSIKKIPRNEEIVYNLEVEDNHNYVANDILVSNCHGLKCSNKISTYVSKLPTHMKFGFTGTLSNWLPDAWNAIGLTGPILKKMRAKKLQDRGFIAVNRTIAVKFLHDKNLKAPPELLEMMKIAQDQRDDELIGMLKLEIAKARFPTEWHYIEDCRWTNEFIVKMMASFPGNTILLYDHTEHGDQYEEIFRTYYPDRKIFRIDGSVALKHREEVRVAMEEYDDCFTLGNSKCFAVGISIKNINNVGFGFSSGTSAQKIIQAIGRGLRLKEGKTDVKIVDFWHDFRYSMKHFTARTKLYKEHYDIEMDDIIHKNVKVIPINYIDSL